MASVKQIEEAILKVAGSPSVGAIKDLAPFMAEAIAKLDKPEVKAATDVKGRHLRVVEPMEKRQQKTPTE